MVNNKLSDVAPAVALSAGGENRKAALGDGTAKPGDAVGIVSATGKVVQTDVGASELFVGFLDIRYDTSMDSAIADGDPCEIIVPQTGKIYNVHIVDPVGGVDNDAGQPYGMSATAGAMDALASINTAGVVATLEKDIADGDDYAEIRWL
jgi:ABC-type Fe3+ transport system substrate-binding protein